MATKSIIKQVVLQGPMINDFILAIEGAEKRSGKKGIMQKAYCDVSGNDINKMFEDNE